MVSKFADGRQSLHESICQVPKLTGIGQRIIESRVVGVTVGLGDLDGGYDDDYEDDDDGGYHDSPGPLAPVSGVPPRLILRVGHVSSSLGRPLLLILLVVVLVCFLLLLPLPLPKRVLVRVLVLELLVLRWWWLWSRGVARRRAGQHFYLSVDIPDLEGARVRPAGVSRVAPTHVD